MRDGLSNNYVTSVIQDDLGFKWIATENGLNKYDGNQFSVFTPRNAGSGLQNENIEILYKGKEGKIWIGTKSGGLSCFDPIRNKFVNYNHLLPNQAQGWRISKIAQDGKGRIWVGSYEGRSVQVIDPIKDQYIESFFPEKRINAMIRDEFGNILISAGRSIHKYNVFEERMLSNHLDMEMMVLLEDTVRGKIWMTYNKKLYYLDVLDFEVRKHSSFPEHNEYNILSMSLDRQNRLWLGTRGGGVILGNKELSKFKSHRFSRPFIGKRNVNYESILDIFIDNNDLVWLSTAYGGVIKLSPTANFFYLGNGPNSQIGLTDNNVQQVFHSTRGLMWVGTYAGGVHLSNDGKSFTRLDNLPFTEVYAFLETAEMLLVGAREGLYGVQKNDLHAEPVRFCPDVGWITTLHLDSSSTLWIGTKLNGLARTNIKKDPNLEHLKFENGNSPIKSKRISSLLEDDNSNLWIGTYDGLYRYDKSSDSILSSSHFIQGEMPSAIVHNIYTKKDILWIGTPGGLVKFKINNSSLELVKTYDSSSGLANDFIAAIMSDTKGNLWVSSTYGISKLIPEKEVFINYGPSDGIQSSAFNLASVSQDQESRIYFGGTNGITFFSPEKVDSKSRVPEIVFTRFFIDNQEVEVGDTIDDQIVLKKTITETEKITLSHKDHVFSFSLAAIDYQGNDDVNYEYRLLGLKDQWIQNENRDLIRFTGLKSGSYTLEVRASRDNQHWSEIKSVDLVILPSPWVSKVAYCCYALLLIGIILAVRRVAINQTQLKSKLQIAQIGQEKEHELTEAKLKFFTNISHEFRTPLTLIISPLTEILEKLDLDKTLKKQLVGIQGNANRLLDLINQLLDFRKSEKGMLRLQVAEGDFTSFVKEVYLSFKGLASSKSIRYEFEDHTNELEMTFDRDKMEVVICNLLSNAFKYCPSKGLVKVSLTETHTHSFINVYDSGNGIPKEYQKKIFDRFYQIKETESLKIVGSGIGLSLTKNIVELHHGEIKVNSSPKRGTTFTISLPKGDLHFSDEEKIIDFKNSDHPEKYSSMPLGTSTQVSSLKVQTTASKKETILIVDDNEGIRTYLKDLLSETYSVLEAENGVEAFAYAKNEIPDLVVSDVMMPEMDGITLCEKLKADMSTSHIPVILLTARTSTVFELDGLETGADDYVKKPFNATVLKARIASLLENRQKLKIFYLNQVQFEVDSTIKATDFEGQFLQKAANYVEQHIGSETFGRDSLAEELCMSQSTLLRKIKSLTGLTTSGFIKAVRLKKAAEMICTEETKLVQISFEVGFKDYKHFQRSFKEQYGCSPSEYKEKKRLEVSTKRQDIL